MTVLQAAELMLRTQLPTTDLGDDLHIFPDTMRAGLARGGAEDYDFICVYTRSLTVSHLCIHLFSREMTECVTPLVVDMSTLLHSPPNY